MHSNYPKHIFLVILILTVSIAFANGESIAEDTTIYKGISKSQLLTFLKNEGINADMVTEEIMSLKLSGKKMFLKISSSGTAISFLYMPDNNKATLEKVNAFNQNNDVGRAFLFEDGTPMLQLDLNFEGGVSAANIKHYISKFTYIIRLFDSSMGN